MKQIHKHKKYLGLKKHNQKLAIKLVLHKIQNNNIENILVI